MDHEMNMDIGQVHSLARPWHLSYEELAAAPPAEELLHMLGPLGPALVQFLLALDIEMAEPVDSEQRVLDTINYVWIREEAERTVGEEARCIDCPVRLFEEAYVQPTLTDEKCRQGVIKVIEILDGDALPIYPKLSEEPPRLTAAAACNTRKREGQCDIDRQLKIEIERLKQAGSSVVRAYIQQQEKVPRWRRDDSDWGEKG